MSVTFTHPTLVSFSLPSCCHLVAESCLILCDPMNSSPPGSSVRGIYLIVLSIVKFAEAIRYLLTKELTVYSQQKCNIDSVVSVSVQSLSHVQLFTTPWTVAHQASQSITNTRSLFSLMSTELVMPSNHLNLCCPLLLLPSIFPSIRLFIRLLGQSLLQESSLFCSCSQACTLCCCCCCCLSPGYVVF